MGVKERRERERDQRSDLIIQTAKQIIIEEGLENLSIRKIAHRMEYSPAIIYHYFRDKEDLVHHLMKEGYQKIVSAISSAMALEGPPELKLKNTTRSYIKAALEIPDEYMAIQLSQSKDIAPFTASLFPGASESKPALKLLAENLREIYRDHPISQGQIELTAQIMAASTFGMIMKLILEKNIDSCQREKLIEHFIKCWVDVMILGNKL